MNLEIFQIENGLLRFDLQEKKIIFYIQNSEKLFKKGFVGLDEFLNEYKRWFLNLK